MRASHHARPASLLLCATSAGFLRHRRGGDEARRRHPFLLLLLPVYAALGVSRLVREPGAAGQPVRDRRPLILASEVLVTAGVAVALGEHYSLREIAGTLMIVVGMAVVCQGDGARAGDVPGSRAALAGHP